MATAAAPLELLFHSFPAVKNDNPDLTFRVYLMALDGLSQEALEEVVRKCSQGIWDEPLKYCPTPPNLAIMVRKETQRLRELSTPLPDNRILPKPPAWIAAENKYRRRILLAENVSFDKFKRGKWPVGSCYVAILEKVFAADTTEREKSVKQLSAYQSFVAALKSQRQSESEEAMEDKAEYFAKIESLAKRNDSWQGMPAVDFNRGE